jgi:hypothetical protein
MHDVSRRGVCMATPLVFTNCSIIILHNIKDINIAHIDTV